MAANNRHIITVCAGCASSGEHIHFYVNGAPAGPRVPLQEGGPSTQNPEIQHQPGSGVLPARRSTGEDARND